MAKEINKRINVWVNGKEVENNIKSIRSAMLHLTNQLNKMEIGSAEYIKTSEDLRKLKGIYDEHCKSLRMTGDELEKNSERTRNNIIMYGGLSTALQGASSLLQRFVASTQEYVEAYATLDDAMSAVQKTTGMTREEVEGLHKSLKSIDTRTSTNELLKIAEIGGRMGLAKDQIQGFTEAVNKANVALGDSFQGGAEEISSILGKISLAYKETRDQDIGKSLTQIGSALNEVGASANATEGNIAAFVQRVGSMPEVFRPTVQQAVALGAAFEESSIDAEVASRAFGIVMMKASTNVKAFATVMRRPAEEIQNLINTNPAQFFVEFAASLKGMEATEVGAVLKDLKLNADGVNKIIGAMSTSKERFTEILNTSNTAFSEAISLDKEYSVVNENAAAKLEKAKKRMQEAREEMGQQLIPILTTLYNVLSKAAGGVSSLTEWFLKHKVVLGTIISIVGLYITTIVTARLKTIALTAVQKLATIATKAHTVAVYALAAAQALAHKNTGRATAAFTVLARKVPEATRAIRALSIATKGLIAIGLAYGLYKAAEAAVEYSQKLQHARNHTDEMDAAYRNFMEHADEYTQKQRNLVEELVDLIHDENAGYNEKAEAINKLKEIIPGYNALLSETGDLIYENVDAITAFTEISDLANQKKALQEGLNALKKERDDFFKDNEEKIKEFQSKDWKMMEWKVQGNFVQKIYASFWQATHIRNESFKSAASDELHHMNTLIDEQFTEIQNKSKEIDKKMEALKDKYKKPKQDSTATDSHTTETEEESKEKLRKRQSFLKKLAEQERKDSEEALNEWEKIKAQIKAKHQELIDESIELFGKNNIYIKRIQTSEANAIAAAGQKYLEKTKDFVTKFATELDQMLADTQGDNGEPQSRLVAAIAGSDKEWEKAIAKAEENAKALEKILSDMDENDPLWNDFATQLAAVQDQIDAAQLKQVEARAAITKKFVEEEMKGLKQREKEQQRQIALNRQGITEEQKAALQRQWKIDDLREEYDVEIKLMEAALKAAEANKDAEGIENIEKMIEMLKELRNNVEATVDAGTNGTKKTGNALIDLMTGALTNPQERFRAVLDVMQDFANRAADIYQQIADAQQQSAELDMERFNDAQDAKARKLRQQLDDGLISQKYYDAQMEKMEAEKEQREKKMKHEQFERERKSAIVQALIQGGLAVARGFAEWGWPGGLIVGAFTTAETAAQVALIASQVNPYAKGGYIRKKQLALVGEEGQEWVASNSLLEDEETAPVIAALEEYQRGNRNALRLVAPTQPAWKNLSQSASQISSTFASNRTPVEHHYYQSAGTDELLKEVKQMNQFLADPKNRQAYISYKIQTEAQKNRDFIKQAARL